MAIGRLHINDKVMHFGVYLAGPTHPYAHRNPRVSPCCVASPHRQSETPLRDPRDRRCLPPDFKVSAESHPAMVRENSAGR